MCVMYFPCQHYAGFLRGEKHVLTKNYSFYTEASVAEASISVTMWTVMACLCHAALLFTTAAFTGYPLPQLSAA